MQVAGVGLGTLAGSLLLSSRAFGEFSQQAECRSWPWQLRGPLALRGGGGPLPHRHSVGQPGPEVEAWASVWVPAGRYVLVGLLRQDGAEDGARRMDGAAGGQPSLGQEGAGWREVFTWTGLTLQVDVLFRLLCRAWHLRKGGPAFNQ